MNTEGHCLNCNALLTGRAGKKFCDPYCKSNFHYEKQKKKEVPLFTKIDRQLKKNRRILIHFNKAGKATIREELLMDAGFDPNYFTHFWRNSKKQAYLFCYEYGYLKITENNRTKYVLITWQDYMKK